ncbi:phosphoenolpyruvate--protein phosphotransferase [Tistrella mobilis]|uniref:phosphoenolpyruvate--protein phosphotransferase n=1 Tax=Tistrella mobilis TaxID=171437 RepID=UPI0031F60016
MSAPASAIPGPRRLLRRLRDVMAAPGTAQSRLNQVVLVIAADMVAEVCSIYVRRAGDVLELFATEGLNPEAVHKTRLRVGEGLVGHIAAQASALSLSDAQSHPDFAYRPETGEEIYHSLMGVPILRSGRVVGVLVVQNRTRRNYAEEELEALQTVAMVLAELIGAGDLVNPSEFLEAEGNATLPQRAEGVRLADGVAMGIAVLHRQAIEVRQLVAEDPEVEAERLADALERLRASVDRMLARPDIAIGGEHREVLETYRMFAHDRGWISKINDAIRNGLTAEAAVKRTLDDMRVRLNASGDPYLRERVLDLEDIAGRLLGLLNGEPEPQTRELPDDMVVVARAMGPAELLDYDRTRLRGLVLEEGSATAHVAIVARALDIPVLGRVDGALSRITPGDPVIVDADNNQLIIRPGEDVVDAVQLTLAARAERKAAFAALRHMPSITRDDVRVNLLMNAGLLADMGMLAESGAEGIGLYRTELFFMVRSQIPDVAAQADLYARVLDQSGEKPVYFRTLDVGSDKQLPYFNHRPEENPAMGWRSLRLTLDRPAMLRRQVRALLMASAGRQLNIMFPMVAEVAEFDAARRLVQMEVARARRQQQRLPSQVRVGTMLEVPALAWQLKPLLERVDFISVGSNDLLQFFFACDRGNPELADRYDLLSPAVLGFLRNLVDACARADVELSLCGEMASRPLEAMALIGLGFRRMSMPAGAIGPVKAMVRSLDRGHLASYMATLLDLPDHSVRDRLMAFAHDHGIAI